MRRLLLFLLVPAMGCATSRSADVDLLGMPQIRTLMAGAVSPGGEEMGSATTTLRYEEDPVIIEEVVAVEWAKVWPALLGAFAEEGLPPDGMDRGTGLISVSRTEWTRERRGLPLSLFLDCGASESGRPLAEDARVVAAVAAQAKAEGAASTRIRVRFEAVAFPLGSTPGRVQGCRTTGELEHTVVRRVKEALGLATPEPEEGGIPVRLPSPDPGRPGQPQPVSGAPALLPADSPFQPGDQVRVWLSDSERLTGAFLGLRADSLLLRRSRRTALPVRAVQTLQVKRTNSTAILIGSLAGVAAGVSVALSTDLGIGGRHAVQGRILNPGLGAVAGGLAGAAVGAVFFGTSWVTVPLDFLRPEAPGTEPARIPGGH